VIQWQRRKKSIKHLIAWLIRALAKASERSFLGTILTRNEETTYFLLLLVPALSIMLRI
jgi:hypothetical protein